MSKEEIIEAIDKVIKLVNSGKQDPVNGIQEIQSIVSLNQNPFYRTWYLEKYGKLPIVIPTVPPSEREKTQR